MSYTAPIAEQRFVLDHVARIAELGVDADTLDAVLEGAAQLASREWAPLSHAGDTIGPQLIGADVVMPEGYRAAYKAFVDGGWGTIGAPAGAGGQGLPFVVQAAVLETLGSANMGFALAPILTIGAVEALQHHGSPTQKAAYLPKLVTGEWTGTMNLTEPQAGSDVGALRCTATLADDGMWRVKGTKIFISFGDHDLTENIIHLVLARTPNAPEGTKGISLFLVPKVRPNGTRNDVRTVSIEHKLGLHASPTCVLSFGDHDDCTGELIGPEGGGMRAMFTMMNNARLNVGLQGVQVAEAATQKAAAYARERMQGVRTGAPSAIIEHPDVRRMLMRMRAQTDAARALVYYACAQVERAKHDADAHDRLEIMIPLAKAHATDLGNEVASLGVQVHGGMGFIEETGAARFFRDARITPIYEGTNGIQAADLVGRKLALSNGAAFEKLIVDMRNGAHHPALGKLIALCEAVGHRLQDANPDDRLAASYPFLTMLSVATSGWLLSREAASHSASATKKALVDFYLDQLVPEALGLEAAASAPAAQLYEISAAQL
ncbi:acyl-CoA dehydrogenase [Sphingomonadaceae bacterium OTU29LAMAA1]|nr:acyl-CoA dehydrogenase [Sphingomonadaceae bacterium OTU29LAMAA1]